MIKKAFGWIVLLFIILWFGQALYAERTVLYKQILSMNLGTVMLSFLVLAAVFLLVVIIWRALFTDVGYMLSFREAFQILHISSLGRYVPGRVWQFSSVVYLLHKSGIPIEDAATISIISQLLTLVTGIVVSSPVLMVWLGNSGNNITLTLSIISSSALLIVVGLYPSLWIGCVNLALRLMGRQRVVLSFQSKRLWRYVGGYAVAWIGLGLALYLLISSLYDVELKMLPAIAGSFAFAYIVGYVAVFAPGGLGVREGALAIALSFFLPGSIAIPIAVLSRFWFMSAELVFVGVALYLRSRERVVTSKGTWPNA